MIYENRKQRFTYHKEGVFWGVGTLEHDLRCIFQRCKGDGVSTVYFGIIAVDNLQLGNRFKSIKYYEQRGWLDKFRLDGVCLTIRDDFALS